MKEAAEHADRQTRQPEPTLYERPIARHAARRAPKERRTEKHLSEGDDPFARVDLLTASPLPA